MRCFWSASVMVLLCGSLLAQTPTVPGPKPSDDSETLAIVSGRVVTAAEGSPLKSARVALAPEHSRAHRQIFAATSDSDGRFTIKDVEPGRYEFFASHSGFVRQNYKATSKNDEGAVLSLRGDNIDSLAISLGDGRTPVC